MTAEYWKENFNKKYLLQKYFKFLSAPVAYLNMWNVLSQRSPLKGKNLNDYSFKIKDLKLRAIFITLKEDGWRIISFGSRERKINTKI